MTCFGCGGGGCSMQWVLQWRRNSRQTSWKTVVRVARFLTRIVAFCLLDLDGITQRLARLGYLPLYTPLFEVLCNAANLFACILNNSWHVLHQLSPSIKNHSPFPATLQVS